MGGLDRELRCVHRLQRELKVAGVSWTRGPGDESPGRRRADNRSHRQGQRGVSNERHVHVFGLREDKQTLESRTTTGPPKSIIIFLHQTRLNDYYNYYHVIIILHVFISNRIHFTPNNIVTFDE